MIDLRHEATGHAGPTHDPDLWFPTLGSQASREPGLRSRYSSRGFFVDAGRIKFFESHLELLVGTALVTDRNISSFVEQPKPVHYFDGGKPLHHTFDFWATHTSGRRTAVAVKDVAHVERSGIRRTIELVAAQVGRAFADDIVLVTELDFTRNERFNSEQAFEICRDSDPTSDAHVAEFFSNVSGAVRISDAVRATGLGAAAFQSVVRLITCGPLELVGIDARVDYDAHVRGSRR